jgi:Domain of unknown function (DUF4440)
MIFKRVNKLASVLMVSGFIVPAAKAQQGKWAAASDQTARFLIDMERQWVESGCTHSGIIQTILADDFQGTTNGSRYSKSEAIAREKTAKLQFRECRLSDAKVHLFGDNIAIVYGTESAIRRASEGKEQAETHIWTDTWLKRNGTWQIVAAQDMPANCK